MYLPAQPTTIPYHSNALYGALECPCPVCKHHQVESYKLSKLNPIVQQTQIPPIPTYQYPVHQTQVVVRYPVVHDVHHVQRQACYVSVEDIERPQRERYLALQRQYAELRIEKPVKESVDPQIAYELDRQIKQLQGEIRYKDDTVHELQRTIDNLQNDILISQQTQLTVLEAETDQWKLNFIQLNKQFNNNNEDLMMKLAEIESIKRKFADQEKQKLAIKTSYTRDVNETTPQTSPRTHKPSQFYEQSPKKKK